MYHSASYARSTPGGAQLWAITRELDTLSTDDVRVGETVLTDRLESTPVLRRVRAAADFNVDWSDIQQPPGPGSTLEVDLARCPPGTRSR